MSKGLRLTIIDKLIKTNNLSLSHVARCLGLTHTRLQQLKRENFLSLNLKYLYILSSLFNIKPYELLYMLEKNTTEKPPIIDEEKLNLMLKEL